jgi:predicted RNA binding protein with dsRBD fold (UPF0201 family)
MNEYYTYAYLREDGTPYYIGKGSDKRITRRVKRDTRPPKDKSRIIFLKQNLTEEEAFKHEIYMISVFGRKDLGTGVLYNRTDGGEGVSGRIVTDETRNKIRQKLKGKEFTDTRRKNISDGLRGKSAVWNIGNTYTKGKKLTEEHKRKLSERQKGKTFTEEHKLKISKSLTGRKLSEEQKEKITKSLIGRKQSEETKNKLKKALMGHSVSDETRKKISETLKSKNVGKWWTNGQITKRSIECPGDGWVLGRKL